MRSLALALLAGCGTPQRPVAPPPPPPKAPPRSIIPEDCVTGGYLDTPASVDHADELQVGKITIKLFKCHVDGPGEHPDDPPIHNWHAYLIRNGDPYPLPLAIYEASEASSTITMIGVVPESPVVILEQESSGMGLGTDTYAFFRVDGVPEQLEPTFSGRPSTMAIGEHEVVVSTCTVYDDPDCLLTDANVATHTVRWANGKLEVSP